MTRKIIYIVLTFFTLTVLTIIYQSCRDLFVKEGRICEISFTGIYQSKDNSPDEFLNNQIGFSILGDRGQSCYAPTEFSFISSCYATTKCVKWQNEIITSSFQLSLDRQVIISGDTIATNTDLFQNSNFRNGTTIEKDENDCKFVQITIMLSADLISKMTFEQGVYNVSFFCTTNDSKSFNKQRQVIFKK